MTTPTPELSDAALQALDEVATADMKHSGPRCSITGNPCCTDTWIGNDYPDCHCGRILRDLAAAQEALAAYKKRNEGNAIHRLHNICDALDAEARDSPYSEEAWQLQEEAYSAKCAELKAAQSALKAAEERAERNARETKLLQKLRRIVPRLIEVARMPNIEHVADEHNEAVKELRAAIASGEGK